MLPATLAQNVRRQIRHYLEATFNFRRPEEEAAFAAFVNDPAGGLFKGPWVRLSRPFRPAPDTYDPAALFDVTPPFHPFRHQWQAWQRLSSKGRVPDSTIVTTGTGSGKTECFMYPVLDHALRAVRRGEAGIKAIILYPMNALASDQAGRFAEEIFSRPELHEGTGPDRRARVRVGLFTGRDDDAEDEAGAGGGERPRDGAVSRMAVVVENGREQYRHITDRAAMLDDPPDILLTNYKMLDYLLMKPKYRPVWRHNAPGRLGYLVLDELHTYDGAQGADVGCLIRRLKDRLDIARGGLCCVGTSATIAGGRTEEEMDPLQRLAEFAGTLFEEQFTPAMIVNEEGNRLDASELVDLAKDRATPDWLPTAAACTPGDDETAAAFARRVAPLFGAPAYPLSPAENRWAGKVTHRPDDEKYWGLALGHWLRGQELFKALLDLTASPVLTWDALVDGLSDRFFALRAVGPAGPGGPRDMVVAAFFALIAQARQLRSGRALPLVPTQVQVWVRELRRLGRFVTPEPKFGWLDERRPDTPILPVAHCSECGESAWMALIDPDSRSVLGAQGVTGFRLIDEPTLIYQGSGIDGAPSPELVVMSPWYPGDGAEREPDAPEFAAMDWYLAPESLVVRQGEGACPLTGARSFRVTLFNERKRKEDGRVVGRKVCPHCGAQDSLMFIGSRAATVSSVAIDEMFGSVLNSDPKLLAFTDSVQDASHRAGFFSARTYNFTFRTALQRIVGEAGRDGVPLVETGPRLLDYWSQPVPGRPGHQGGMVEAIGTLLPPDLREYGPYVAYRDGTGGSPPGDLLADLLAEVTRRLTWEAVSEFGLMLTHGRTLEQNASACLGWDAGVIAAVVAAVHGRLTSVDPALAGVTPQALRLWIFGILQRQREKGGLSHQFVAAFARGGLWGKKNYGRIVPGRETFPLHGRYVPRLLADQPDQRHSFLLATMKKGAQPPWPTLWARRALGGMARLAGVGETALADLHRVLLDEGVKAGLFVRLDRGEGKGPLYAIAASAARLFEDGYFLRCDGSGHALFRPAGEAAAWEGAPSLVRSTPHGRYRLAPLSERQNYYRARYRKGALRRVFAQEHTGLLTTSEREDLERRFNAAAHADDPNVITATSTLEMGIDIGDLSTTMLCSVPPTTASYLQRIGRAGRTTGTALVVSVVNQRPHDLFFFARPEEMLAGTVQPPGCWLDASAMLARQYLAFCIDRAVKEGAVDRLPASGKRLMEEMDSRQGAIVDLLGWIALHEASLQQAFLSRFGTEVGEDTRARFRQEATVERLYHRIGEAAAEFGVQVRSIEAARDRLNREKRELADGSDEAGLRDVERELRILKARMATLNRTAALEVLTEHGLLPNYAFPERGVRLAGTVYRDREGPAAEESTALTIDVTRAAAVAIRELAPGNIFYTHGHQFAIQQLSIGTQAQPLVQTWAVCGKCGHMRPAEEVERPDTPLACPQCGYDRQQQSQRDKAQHKPFLHFAQSGAISYMEYYDSLSGDRAEERDRKFYRLVTSFDLTAPGDVHAIGTEGEAFGLEYRSALVLRQVNGGPGDAAASFDFGPDQKVPELGFPVCQDCGVVAYGDANLDNVSHRKSCQGRKRTEKHQREGRSTSGYRWQRVYLYRELKSEAIRILLPPDLEAADVSTLRACLFLGLRLHFRGFPGHLLIEPQVLPDHRQDVRRQYLVLMDAVPGGTGFLKSLFVPKQEGERSGEGIMTVLRLALNALESCDCRVLGPAPGQDDTDGCYRCIRAYHLQYKAEEIGRERGIVLLRAMIDAGGRRTEIATLDDIKVSSQYGSVLEKKFIDRLQAIVLAGGGSWDKALVKGTAGFRFRLGADTRVWDIQLQPKLGPSQGVAIPCQPDFLLICDDAAVRPIAVFTDGFEYHAEPDKPTSRLPDDAAKRRAILASGRYWVWSITWHDLLDGPEAELALVPAKVRDVLHGQTAILKSGGVLCPPASHALGNGMNQLCAFLARPDAEGWMHLAGQMVLVPLTILAGKHAAGALASEMLDLHDAWQTGQPVAEMTPAGGTGSWYHATRLASGGDLLVMGRQEDIVAGARQRMLARLRLGDSADERAGATYLERWRRWLGLANLLQFTAGFHWFCVSEVAAGSAPDLELAGEAVDAADWSAVLGDILPSLRPLAERMAAAGIAMPEIEVYLDGAPDDCFAEMAWPWAAVPVCMLVGDQSTFAAAWEGEGWTVVTPDAVQANGIEWMASLLVASKETV
ncbi:DEAD/DEAH box helicase [Azospirillum sp. BE72]|uniref:DEAD/DEAH box helicase n=1 Tax=Azospirillum sp. BE72 TaxID=2817776 RepID=UPI00285FD87C|nr:DEAD/DEAH box helicase [Azospirillum sp. BE72]MDR6775336.1 DEAD/DEAH box helicase domain-containing protein [Azospirillum sp. BE72]